jgi:hypothetical protein
MSDLLKSAIADAKAVRETALQNAKAVLEEAFTPKLQSMLATKLQQEMAGEEEETLEEFTSLQNDGTGAAGFIGRDGEVMNEEEVPADEHTVDPQGPSNELQAGPSDQDTDSTSNGVDSPKAGGTLTPSKTDKSSQKDGGSEIGASDQDANQTPDVDTSRELTLENDCEVEDEELNEIIAELEGELEPEMGEEEEFSAEDETELAPEMGEELPAEEGGEEIDIEIEDDEIEGEESAAPAVDDVAGEEGEEEIDLEEILREMELGAEEAAEEEVDVGGMQDEIESLQQENAEYKKALGFLKEKLNEVNMLNSKLLFTNKVFKSFGLNNDQKMRVVEAFDRAQSVREVKLTYANLCESFKIVNSGKKKSAITEGVASKVVKSTKPRKETTKKILSEGNEIAARFQKLAGIKR